MGIFGEVGTGLPLLLAKMRLLHSDEMPPASCLLPVPPMIRFIDSSWLKAFRIMCFLDQALCGTALGRGNCGPPEPDEALVGVGVEEVEDEAEVDEMDAGMGDGVLDGTDPGDWGIDTDSGEENTGGVRVFPGSMVSVGVEDEDELLVDDLSSTE